MSVWIGGTRFGRAKAVTDQVTSRPRFRQSFEARVVDESGDGRWGAQRRIVEREPANS